MAFDIDPERVARNPFFVGLIGSAITAFRFTPGASIGEKAFNGLAGAAIAGYGAPLVAEVTSQVSPHFLSVVALVLGLVGMSLCDQLIKAGKQTQLGQFLAGWVERFSAKKGG